LYGSTLFINTLGRESLATFLSTLVGEVASRKPEGEVQSCAVLYWRLEPRS